LKNISPYWFLKDPIDLEHKYYVLMDFLQSIEKDLDNKKYSDQIQKLNRVYNDLKNFQKFKRLSDKTIKSLTQDEIENVKLLAKNAINTGVSEIIRNSLDKLDEFIKKISPYMREIEKSLDFKIINDDFVRKDRGYITIRNNKDKKMKVYSWVFSIVKVDETEQVGLLLCELLDPLPLYTKSNRKIYDFFLKEIKNFSKTSDCFIVVDLEKSKGESEISFDLMKEKSIEFIVENYKKYLSEF
jgi:hypothetical protein